LVDLAYIASFKYGEYEKATVAKRVNCPGTESALST